MSLFNFKISATYTDLYQLTMAQVYYLDNQQDNTAVFDYYFRKLPFEGGYAVFAGLEDVLELLENLHFDEEDIRFLREQGFDLKFLDTSGNSDSEVKYIPAPKVISYSPSDPYSQSRHPSSKHK